MGDGGRLWATAVTAVETELGHALSATPPTRRLRAITALDSAGAFELRGGVRLAAATLGVSRYTVYGYLRRTAPRAPVGT